MRKSITMFLSMALLAGAWTLLFAQVASNDNNIAVMDNCDPTDLTWNTKGGCFLKPHQGDVSLAEFGALLLSKGIAGKGAGILIGHPSWRNEPGYLSARAGQTINVTNKGGRTHTFTEVVNFGGGFVPPLNDGLVLVPECAATAAVPLPPGDKIAIAGLAPGLHNFQCCIHPWMRASVRVE